MDNGTPGKKPPPPFAETRRCGETLILRQTRVQATVDGLRTDIWGDDDYSVVDGDTLWRYAEVKGRT
jgi:hypothetical protein